jgi:hypothetical protein
MKTKLEYRGRQIKINWNDYTVDGEIFDRVYGDLESEIENIKKCIDSEES